MSDGLKPAARRQLARELEQRGYTRERLEAYVRQLLKPRPQWIPRRVWAWGAAIFLRELPGMHRAELEEAERQLVAGVLAWKEIVSSPAHNPIDRMRALECVDELATEVWFFRAHIPQDPAQ